MTSDQIIARLREAGEVERFMPGPNRPRGLLASPKKQGRSPH